ncbi:small integral membrane protein 5 [Eleutherodactylus coqui]|uniref:Small integral membrane protein 5 n=1 Tax=Eleutherodactylus coqui TaxID=57060 RepID=A0A8J6EQT3_ELECQ|nr:hypothetical protein GDO78_004130 [Eleutherodactylus coqui]
MSSSLNIKEELRNLGERLLEKLRQIPQSDTVEIVSFTIILLFIGMVLILGTLACSFHCCCNKNKSRRVAKVRPKPEV